MTQKFEPCSYYTGGAEPASTDSPRKLPTTNVREDWSKPKGYVASQDLMAAVNVAVTLGRPLLVTGEPGTGKSDLAKSVAYDLGLGEPLEFTVKSDTESRELFYSFDAVGRFHAREPLPSANPAPDDPYPATAFITYNALGEAILRSNASGTVGRYRRRGSEVTGPARSVVLIDEIDKAPRDVPNDILSEIDKLAFEIPELSLDAGRPVRVEADKRYRPIVIITSNVEKSLPDAFLRRCVYFHMKFPEPGDLLKIVENRLGALYRDHNAFVDAALSLFHYFRDEALGLSKRPATAELLDWLYVLFYSLPNRKPPELLEDHPRFEASVRCTLLKHETDQDRAGELIARWREQRDPSPAPRRG
jgi:MoxR-like ATPase